MEQFSRLGLAMHLNNLIPDGEEQPVTKGDDPSSKEETDGAVGVASGVGVAKQEVVTLTLHVWTLVHLIHVSID